MFVVVVHALVFPGEDGLGLSPVFVPLELLVIQVFHHAPKFENEGFPFEKVEVPHVIFTAFRR